MKKLLVLCFMGGIVVLVARKKRSQTVTQDYIGSIMNAMGSGGSLLFTVADLALSKASFYRFGQEVKTAPISFNSDGNQMTLSFDYSWEGDKVRARLSGTRQSNSNFEYFMGTYKSTSLVTNQEVETGSWDARLM